MAKIVFFLHLCLLRPPSGEMLGFPWVCCDLESNYSHPGIPQEGPATLSCCKSTSAGEDQGVGGDGLVSWKRFVGRGGVPACLTAGSTAGWCAQLPGTVLRLRQSQAGQPDQELHCAEEYPRQHLQVHRLWALSFSYH